MMKNHSRFYSHIGRRLIPIPENVTINIKSSSFRNPSFRETQKDRIVTLTGPLGISQVELHYGLELKIVPGSIAEEKLVQIDYVEPACLNLSKYKRKFVRSMWGTTTSLLRQKLEGISEGFQVALRLVGVGYRAAIFENMIDLKVGHTHPIKIPIPPDMKVNIPVANRIVINGIDYQRITQFAARIRAYRKPEPFNGKGIFVGSETITIKEGKKK